MSSELHAVDPHPPRANCLNCNSVVIGHYCHHCGQEAVLHRASAREFLHEFIGQYVALEGRLLGTVGRLLFRPGALTNEYVAGRRVRFVQPLRLYLTLSVLFFALIKLSSGLSLPVVEDQSPAHKAHTALPARAQPAPSARAATPDVIVSAGAPKAVPEGAEGDDDKLEPLSGMAMLSWLHGVWPEGGRRLDHFEQLPAEQKRDVITAGFYEFAPYAMFCLLPLFALYLKVLYLGSQRRYGEHLLFALHTHSFAFVMFMCMLLPVAAIVKFGMWLWLLGYLPWAMRRVYQRSRLGTCWRWLTLMSFYALSMVIAFMLTMGAGVLVS